MSSSIEYYVLAGEIASKAMKYGLEMIKPGIPFITVCERVESKIRELGGAPAFPVNLSVNNVAAHYTSPPKDKNIIRKGMLVKLDLGVHVRGYIVDMARSKFVGRPNRRMRDLISAPMEALKNVEKILREGVRVIEISEVIEDTIKGMGFTPVSDLTGHGISRYELHSGITIPNVPSRSTRNISLKEGDVIAIEPFATTGKSGFVKSGPNTYIYALNQDAVKGGDDFLKELYRYFRTLPFTYRWVSWKPQKHLKSILSFYSNSGKVLSFPVLYDADGGIVSQHENTYMITDEGFIKFSSVGGS
ncbi:MAG: type II methionyl aminopeptidase [Candidatus Odinarchaeota archaeon]|nr:type II methionyl aminopeptidase [Candidatus Odinarchaeota archaeon]